jgi:ABC-type oligopeptide transport system substrate-binding subunit
MRTRYVVEFILTSLLFMAPLIACTKKPNQNALYPQSETLWVNWGTEPPTLDWTQANDIVSNNILYNLMEPLVGLNLSSPDLPAQPGLFTKWESTNDFKTWTFQMAEGVQWTDGQPLTVQHILDGFERLLSPAQAAEGAHFIFSIQGAEDYALGKVTDFKKVGVQALDEKQVKITLNQPLVFFPKILTTINTAPFRKDIEARFGRAWTEAQNIVTLGAYRLKEWQHDELIVLERNPNYFGSKAKIQFIAGRMIEDLSASVDLFDAKKLDFHRGLTPADEQRFTSRPELVVQPSLAILYFNFNTRVAPFNSAAARKAIVHSVDRTEVLKTLGRHRKLNKAWLPEGLLGAMPEQGLKFDPILARQLQQSLPKDTQTLLRRLRIESNQNETHLIMLQNIQAQLKKNLGLEIEILMLEWKSYLAKIKNDPAPMFRLGFISLYPDPHFLMNLWRSNSHFNYSGWKSSRYDQLVDLAAVETDLDKRKKLYQDAQQILIDEAPFFNVYTAANLSLVSSRIRGFVPNSLERLEFKSWTLASP